MLSDTLRKDIRNLWDKFWSRGITNPITAIEQISYLLFMRRLEETDNEKIENSSKAKEKYAGEYAEVDHPIPEEADHLFRGKLTTLFRSKLTTPNEPLML